MRVLLAGYGASPQRGSEPGRTWSGACALARAGHDVTLLTSTDYLDEQPPDDRLPPGLAIERVEHLTGALVTPGQAGVYQRYVTWQWRSLARARRLHAERPFDVVHHLSWASLFWGSPLWRVGAPFVVGPLGGGEEVPAGLRCYLGARDRRSEWLRSRAVRSTPWLPHVRSSLRRGTVLVVDAETAALAGRSMTTRRPRLVPIEAPEPAFLVEPAWPLARREPGLVVWAGRFLPRKAVTMAVDVMATLRHRVGTRLVVLGDGPDRARLESAVRAAGLEGRVSIRGEVPHADVRGWLDRAQVFLFTSLRDAFGAQVMEAAARGTPIATLDLQGRNAHLPSAVGVKVPVTTTAATVAALAGGLRRLLEDEEAWQQAHLAARSFAEGHTWDAFALRWTDLYGQAVAGDA